MRSTNEEKLHLFSDLRALPEGFVGQLWTGSRQTLIFSTNTEISCGPGTTGGGCALRNATAAMIAFERLKYWNALQDVSLASKSDDQKH